MKARCISKGSLNLTVGKIYEVSRYLGETYLIKDDFGVQKVALGDRIEIIEEENKMSKEYRITVRENGSQASIYVTDNPNKAIEYIEAQNKNYEVFRYLQDNLVFAKIEVEENGTKVKVTIGDYVLTN